VGGVISPVLANLALDGLERALRERFPKTHQRDAAKVNFVRYADDFIITGSSKELLEEEIRPLVQQFLRQRGLELSEEKTRLTHIEEGFDFLGQTVRKYNGKILIKPSKKNVKLFLGKVRAIIKANKQATPGNLLLLLNPVIRGWAQYHRHVASSKTFSKVDYAIHQALWHWAQRRHPGKSKRWVKEKYFRSHARQHWDFHGEVDGKIHSRFLTRNLPIKRHVKIVGTANPFDPAWEVYFEHRLGVKMADDLKGRRQLLHLWKEQNGLCPVCNQKMTQITGWHNHHIIWRSLGGADTTENRVLLHPTCHNQVHSRKLYVEKPRPIRGEREA
jgi:RNA-directed DNA polymerase